MSKSKVEKVELKNYTKVDLKKDKEVTTEKVLTHGTAIVEKQLENQLAISAGAEMVKQSIEEQKALSNVIKNALIEDTHYGVIPGTTNKTLLQPGADVLAKMYGIQVKYDILDKSLDIASGYIDYEYRATLLWRGKEITTADASANTLESKFRLHFQKLKPTAACQELIDAQSKLKTKGKPKKHLCENCEWVAIPGKSPFDIKNTMQQMAQKRAMVRGIRKALGITGSFTQDMENGERAATREQKFNVYNALYVYLTADMGKNKTDRQSWMKLNVLKPIQISEVNGRGFTKWSGEDTDKIVEFLDDQDKVNAIIAEAKEVKNV